MQAQASFYWIVLCRKIVWNILHVNLALRLSKVNWEEMLQQPLRCCAKFACGSLSFGIACPCKLRASGWPVLKSFCVSPQHTKSWVWWWTWVLLPRLRHHLRKHSNMHTGVRPYKCTREGCDFSTKDHRNLKQVPALITRALKLVSHIPRVTLFCVKWRFSCPINTH